MNIELSDNYIYLKVLRYCLELLTTFPTVSTVYNNLELLRVSNNMLSLLQKYGNYVFVYIWLIVQSWIWEEINLLPDYTIVYIFAMYMMNLVIFNFAEAFWHNIPVRMLFKCKRISFFVDKKLFYSYLSLILFTSFITYAQLSLSLIYRSWEWYGVSVCGIILRVSLIVYVLDWLNYGKRMTNAYEKWAYVLLPPCTLLDYKIPREVLSPEAEDIDNEIVKYKLDIEKETKTLKKLLSKVFNGGRTHQE